MFRPHTLWTSSADMGYLLIIGIYFNLPVIVRSFWTGASLMNSWQLGGSNTYIHNSLINYITTPNNISGVILTIIYISFLGLYLFHFVEIIFYVGFLLFLSIQREMSQIIFASLSPSVMLYSRYCILYRLFLVKQWDLFCFLYLILELSLERRSFVDGNTDKKINTNRVSSALKLISVLNFTNQNLYRNNVKRAWKYCSFKSEWYQWRTGNWLLGMALHVAEFWCSNLFED